MSTFQLKKEPKPENPFDRIKKVQFRLTHKDYAVLKQKAALYTEGNVSHWIRAALKNYRPRKSELELS